MVNAEADPWTRWYESYRAGRFALHKAAAAGRERRRAANIVAGLLLAYILVGGLIAGVAVGVVMAN
ncbi:hypothetical protein P7D22_01830 [Lichenihabitans sp. Uapishka_5]|uniref:hypothetical protein n=1 Tax=Lichenihabitans sp. Uapishka_5 TaxID=3037302 RepID=UPI0029E7ECEB|nr:hypothetical protein [Lichenihabitans sp. Uapishka_5]MDX7949915.1 hypothetical protein [Lichenihabitans sp. Uapishka_5]